MQVSPISDAQTAAQSQSSSTQQAATDAFGLSFESLLKIILTQLTYQDPLKPMDNFEFVSQLAQFSQIQIGQTGNDRLEQMATAQANVQAASLLGRTVEIPAGSATLSGKVVAVTFDNGAPKIAIKTAQDQTISNISISAVTSIKEGN
ncbi:flagellar hook capping FlgD N-terminal domain-containing protein [Sphingomonas sp.]|uniref:flagellar hook assembly protein FlgD n=1 Tax=Sphingomonas sp. TaxID=28214 RepID=UPI0025D0B885|nr:flagellar hook capping FlgD N-terminal domain-containing protein [Sphingomonas sp.]